MMNIRYFVFILILTFFCSNIYSQSKWKKSPFFTIEAAGDYDLPIQESQGNVGDFFKFQNYGTSLGWGAQFNFKFGLGPQGQYRPYATLGYAQLEGRDNNAFIDSNEIEHGFPLQGSVYNPTPGWSKIIIRNPFIGGGFEYAFTFLDKKRRAIIPFAGIEFDLNIITGIVRQFVQNALNPMNSGSEVPFTIKSDLRVGMGAGVGADWRFTQSFGITFGMKYKNANLMGKSSIFLKEDNKMNIDDKAATDLNSSLNHDRNIAYLEFYLGASFFVGSTKK